MKPSRGTRRIVEQIGLTNDSKSAVNPGIKGMWRVKKLRESWMGEGQASTGLWLPGEIICFKTEVICNLL